MAVTPEENEIAQRVVEKSKSEARTDTGRLKRSINKKVQRGMIVFRELFYGDYPEKGGRKNSTLEQNAKNMMGDIPYKIERLDESGNIVGNETVYSSGRRINIPAEGAKRRGAMDLIQEILKKRANEQKENSDKDN